MNLISVYERRDRHGRLYALLVERDEAVNISHRAMPSWDEHVKFVNSKPYEAWYFICDPDPIGACYLTDRNEIGVFIHKDHQGKGYGPKAVQALMAEHGPRCYLANINPENEKSAQLFTKLGFTLIQHTYQSTPSKSSATSKEQSAITPARRTA